MMGYRSDVMVLIYPDTDNKTDQQALYGQLKVLMATTFAEVAQHFSAEMYWLDEDRILKFDIENTKWYPHYSDVQMFESMMNQFVNGIEGYCTEFARVGEDYKDIEVIGNGNNCQYYLGVNREITFQL
jgi:hypothetical protein